MSTTNCTVELWNNKDLVVQLSKSNIYVHWHFIPGMVEITTDESVSQAVRLKHQVSSDQMCKRVR